MKYIIYTLGCKVNQYETQAIEALLVSRGHKPCVEGEIADAVIVNTCAVTAEAGRKSRQAIHRLREENPGAVAAVLGCYSQLSPDAVQKLGADIVYGTADRLKLVDALEKAVSTGEGEKVLDKPFERRVFEELPAGAVSGHTRALLKIQDGCNNFCSYCIIPYARGRIRSRKMDSIKDELERLANNGFKEVVFMVNGQGAYSRLKYESGVHRVQRVPETESQGRVHTSTVTVAVLPEADEVELDLNEEKDLKIDVFRSSGAGGQHINKTSSAIRITHLPTGMVVECQDERSQFKNKEKALKVLRSRLLDQKVQAQNKEIADNRRSQVGTGDRSERIRTYNYPEGRISDHRIGLTIYRLEQVLNGALDEIIDALATADQAAKLASQEEE